MDNGEEKSKYPKIPEKYRIEHIRGLEDGQEKEKENNLSTRRKNNHNS